MTSPESPHVLLEGFIKHRDSRKWKHRWAVICKLSPVADCLYVRFYRGCKEKMQKATPKMEIALERYLGIESGFTLDRESNTLAILTESVTVILAFETREILHQWQQTLQSHFTHEQHFLVQILAVPSKSKLPCGQARLLLQDWTFALVSGIPPRALFVWHTQHLRRFGTVDDKFCFEAGSQSGKGMGLHILYSHQSDQLTKYLELASSGQLGSYLEQTEAHKRPENLYTCNKYENCSEKEAKSTSSDSSSICDSLSQITATVDDSISGYYLNSHYNSTVSLSHQESPVSGRCLCSHRGKWSAGKNATTTRCQLHSSVSSSQVFSSNTISRWSNIKSDLVNCCHRPAQLAYHCQSEMLVKSSSPSTVTLAAHCGIVNDRSSLFSHSSQESSGSSSGCSATTGCVSLLDSRNSSNESSFGPQSCKSLSEGQPHRCNSQEVRDKQSCDCSVRVPVEDVSFDEFISNSHNGDPPSRQHGTLVIANNGTSNHNSHLYCRITPRTLVHSNYDIPKNVCPLNSALTLPGPIQAEGSIMNDGVCDATQLPVANGHKETANWCITSGTDKASVDGSDKLNPLGGRTACLACSTHCSTRGERLGPSSTPEQKHWQWGMRAACLHTERRAMPGSDCTTPPALHPTRFTAPQLQPSNYENMNFIRSLELYENMCFHVADQCNGDGKPFPELLNYESNNQSQTMMRSLGCNGSTEKQSHFLSESEKENTCELNSNGIHFESSQDTTEIKDSDTLIVKSYQFLPVFKRISQRASSEQTLTNELNFETTRNNSFRFRQMRNKSYSSDDLANRVKQWLVPSESADQHFGQVVKLLKQEVTPNNQRKCQERLSWTCNQSQTSCRDSDSDSDFCSNSQITILCQNQT